MSEKKSNHALIKLTVIIAASAVLICGISFLVLKIWSNRNGISQSEITKLTGNTEGIEHFIPELIGDPFIEPPRISDLSADDLDSDGLLDVIVCDALNNTISWIRQFPAGVYKETELAAELIAPAHILVNDFDNDGDKDLLVAVLGFLFPSNEKVGSVVILENDGNFNFSKHIILKNTSRVSDVRAGDLDNDGDKDLAVVQFGYEDGETRWIENMGDWKFRSHVLQNLSGGINIEVTDIDNDSDLDMVSLISQEWEEIYLYINDGKGNFKINQVFKSDNEDFGSSSIYLSDLDGDTDEDILYTNGDSFDFLPPPGNEWHGVQWLENTGNYNFQFHRICSFIGAYNARPLDFDNDKDLDVFVVSAFNIWSRPDAMSLIWLENNGNQEFLMTEITNNPTHLITLETGDFNNDGLIDLITGGMHAYPPYDRMSRVTMWANTGNILKIVH